MEKRPKLCHQAILRGKNFPELNNKGGLANSYFRIFQNCLNLKRGCHKKKGFPGIKRQKIKGPLLLLSMGEYIKNPIN